MMLSLAWIVVLGNRKSLSKREGGKSIGKKIQEDGVKGLIEAEREARYAPLPPTRVVLQTVARVRGRRPGKPENRIDGGKKDG